MPTFYTLQRVATYVGSANSSRADCVSKSVSDALNAQIMLISCTNSSIKLASTDSQYIELTTSPSIVFLSESFGADGFLIDGVIVMTSRLNGEGQTLQL